MALHVPEVWFWFAETKKNLKNLACRHVCDLVLNYWSHINGKHWLRLFFYFNLLKDMVVSAIGMSFFISALSFRLKFLRLAVSRRRLQLKFKIDLTTILLFLEFFVGICLDLSISYVHGLKSVWIAQLFFFFDDVKVFRWFAWEGFWSGL